MSSKYNLMLCLSHYKPVTQIPQWTSLISHKTTFCNRNVHISGTKWCAVGYLMHCGICAKTNNASDKYPTMYHFVTKMCILVHISVTKCCIVGNIQDIITTAPDYILYVNWTCFNSYIAVISRYQDTPLNWQSLNLWHVWTITHSRSYGCNNLSMP